MIGKHPPTEVEGRQKVRPGLEVPGMSVSHLYFNMGFKLRKTIFNILLRRLAMR